jgi:hypothetical protein
MYTAGDYSRKLHTAGDYSRKVTGRFVHSQLIQQESDTEICTQPVSTAGK